MAHKKEKISSQAYPEKWEAIGEIARKEGRNIDAILDEALTDYLEKKNLKMPKKSVMDAYNSSHERYSELYKLLAK